MQSQLVLDIQRLERQSQRIQNHIDTLIRFKDPATIEQVKQLIELRKTILQEINDKHQQLINHKNLENTEKLTALRIKELEETIKNNNRNYELQYAKQKNEEHQTAIYEQKLKFEKGRKFWISGVFGVLISVLAALVGLGALLIRLDLLQLAK